jgi:hypothetical protein
MSTLYQVSSTRQTPPMPATSPTERGTQTRWPLRLGRLMRDTLQAYADAASLPYRVTLGLDREQQRTPPDRDDER